MGKDRISKQDRQKLMEQAKRVVYITIAYLLFDILVLYMVMQNSQAMKAAWVEDLLYLLPSLSFLIAAHLSQRPPDKEYRFGYERAFSVGFLISAFALFTIGAYLLIDSLLKLVNQEVIAIGSTSVFGETVWFGWIMVLAIGYSILPVYLIGKRKLEITKKLNFQILYVDAKGQKADWLTSVATIIGLLLVGYGYWWGDAAAAIIISVDIISDGVKSLKAAFSEIMDRTPLDVLLKEEEPLIKEIEEAIAKEAWVQDFLVRLRKAGNRTTGEVLVLPASGEQLQEKVYELTQKIMKLDWEVTEVVVAPVKKIPRLLNRRNQSP